MGVHSTFEILNDLRVTMNQTPYIKELYGVKGICTNDMLDNRLMYVYEVFNLT